MFSAQQYSGFDPRSIPGCALWLDAQDPNANGSIPSGGSSITTWTDKSGAGKNFTATGTVTFNTSPSRLTTNGSSYLENTTITDSVFTAFYVYQKTSGSGALFTNNNTLNNTGFFPRQSGTGLTSIATSDSTFFQQTSTISDNSINNLVVQYDSSNNIYVHLNGTLNLQSTVAGTITRNRLTLGYRPANNDYMTGSYYEIVYFNTALTTAQRQQVEGYLAWKWGTQANLPTGHPFKSNPTAVRIFQPIDISGCSLWLDAADSSTLTFSSGSNVSQWRDKSGNGRHASNSTSSSQPVLESNRLNGLPALKWDGANDRLDGSLPYPTNGQSTLFVLYEITSSSGVDRRVFDINGNSYGNFGSPQGSLNAEIVLWLAGASYPVNAFYTQTAPSLGWKLYAVNYNGTSSLVWRFGTSMALSGSGANTTPTGTTYTLGNSAFGNDSTPFDGRIGELIFYSGNLTTSQRQQVEGYLAAKWGLSGSLPTTQPFYLQRALPSTPLFTPVNLSNLGIWLDGADSSSITLSAGTSNITQWSDKSGNSRHATGLTSKWTTYPTGANYVQFTASSNSVMSCTGLNCVVNTQYTMFTVYRRDNPPTNPNHPNIQFFCGGSDGTTNARLHIGYESTTSMKYAQWANQYSVTVPTLASPDPINVWGFMQTASQRIMYLNGTIPSGGTNTNSSLVSAQNGGVLGAYQSDPFYSLDGRLYEFVIFTRALSDTERQQMEGYLAWKYGAQTSLPTTHPYYKFRP